MTDFRELHAPSEIYAEDQPSRTNGLHEIPFQVLEAFYLYQHFLILGHQKPDADCATSQLAMSFALKKLQKSCQLVSAGPFMRPEIKPFASHFADSINQDLILQYGKDQVLAIILDCSTKERTGFAAELDGIQTLVIDHHAAGEIDGKLFYCDPHSPSTSILVHNILLQLPLFLFQMDPQQYQTLLQTSIQHLFIDQEIAHILFLGFATDTGFFRFLKPENAGDMLRLVANLIDTRINLQDVYQHMTGNRIQATRRLLGLLLLRAGFLLDGRLCVSYGLQTDRQFWRAETSDNDSFYSLALATQNCEAILLIDEAASGCWNIGLRSLKQHDVGSIAAQFGGGGHKNAAGCRIKEPQLQGVLQTMLDAICKLWDRNTGNLSEVAQYISSAPKYIMEEPPHLR